MANCKNCAAPLAANTNVCQYCGTRNDIDLQQTPFNSIAENPDRPCPCCHIPLQTIELNIGNPLYIQRCNQCFGLFFDTQELEALLNYAVSPAYSTNFQWLDTINQERYQKETKIQYVKCPVCHVLMNRVNFAYRSGVVVDKCQQHGIWLNSGELIHLMEWKRAGGQLAQTNL